VCRKSPGRGHAINELGRCSGAHYDLSVLVALMIDSLISADELLCGIEDDQAEARQQPGDALCLKFDGSAKGRFR